MIWFLAGWAAASGAGGLTIAYFENPSDRPWYAFDLTLAVTYAAIIFAFPLLAVLVWLGALFNGDP